MTRINARDMDFTALNALLRETEGDVEIHGCLGHRFIGAGMGGRKINIHGIPGNALGAYLNGAEIEVFGNAQDAVGDTMNAGTIVVHGNIGDTTGYAMRGGRIYVEGNAGYRTGIHMKEYREHLPVIIIGGRAGSFLGSLCLDCIRTPRQSPSSAISHAPECTAESCSCESAARTSCSRSRSRPDRLWQKTSRKSRNICGNIASCSVWTEKNSCRSPLPS